MRKLFPVITLAIVAITALAFAATRSDDTSDKAPLAPRAVPGTVGSRAPYLVPPSARAAATDFFTTWTQYRYKQIPSEEIRSVDPVVRRGLDAVGPLQDGVDRRKQRVKVVELRSDTYEGNRLEIVATIDDGPLRYPLKTTFERRSGIWVAREVTDIE